MRDHPSLRRELARGELVRLLYRLGRHGASGVLTLRPTSAPGAAAQPEVFVLRRGCALERALDGEPSPRSVGARLLRLAAHDDLALVFEGGVPGIMPPGAANGVGLAAWARAHLEQQLDGALAEALVRRLAGARLAVRPELAPEPADEADRRMLAAMAQPRRLDQIWPLARTPRFRLLAFLHFLRAVGALEVTGVAAERRAPAPRLAPAGDPHRLAALRTLGIDGTAEPEDIRRAYRRLARALHPDLQPDADAARRRALERRFAEVTAAYEALA